MARIPNKQAVFFELDGVLIDEPRLRPDGTVGYLPGVFESLRRIDPSTFQLFIASNRMDIAFGELRERDFKKLCERFLTDMDEQDIHFAKIYSCPYHPKARQRFRKDSVFRKPAPGMFKMAQQEFELNLSRCWSVGHTTTDILAGSRASTGTILLKTGEGGRDGAFCVDPNFVEADIRGAVARIAGFEHALRR